MPKRLTATTRDLEAIRAGAAARADKLKDQPEPKVRISKGPKKHGVNRRRRQQQCEKNRRAKLKEERNRRAAGTFSARARAYWAGETDEHP